MRFIIRNRVNNGYYKVTTEGWTTIKLCTKFPDEETAIKQKLVLERKDRYYQKVEVLSEDDAPENVRN